MQTPAGEGREGIPWLGADCAEHPNEGLRGGPQMENDRKEGKGSGLGQGKTGSQGDSVLRARDCRAPGFYSVTKPW